MKQEISNLIKKALKNIGSNDIDFIVEHPTELSHGDYSTNVAMVAGKKSNTNPKEFAGKIKIELEKDLPKEISKIEIAGPGFINFYLSKEFFVDSITKAEDKEFGKNGNLKGKTIIFEYTAQNPFKQFHIGHLMPNTIGEAFSRLAEWNGAKSIRVSYQGDVGIHVACTIWGMIKHRDAFPHDVDALEDKIKFLGDAYAYGAGEYKDDQQAKKEIEDINKKIFEKSDHELLTYYDKGKAWSLEDFEEIYKLIGTKFDKQYFESEMAEPGLKIVKDNLKNGIFKESDGAVVYEGEQDGLHTRVFINSKGLAVYESKELGLAFTKEKDFKTDLSVVVTANEQKDYFAVVKAALSKIKPEIAEKTMHITHGMLVLPTGKMSSRTGQVISAKDLIEDVKEKVIKKMADRDFNKDEKEKLSEIISISAIKYSILKQSIGKNIVFDFDKSISFEGDSGPYLQYTYTRAKSLLQKAKGEGLKPKAKSESKEISNLEKLIYRFREVIEDAQNDLAPQQIVTYLTDLAGEFNSFYANEKIIDKENKEAEYQLAIAEGAMNVLKNGLEVLGMQVPEKM